MLHPWIPTLLSSDRSYLRWKKTSNTCNRWNALMSYQYPENYSSFWATDGLLICWRCNQVGHFVRACPGNLPPPRAPTHYQNHWHNYVPSARSQFHGHPTLPISPLTNIPNALPIDHTPIDIILWVNVTCEMPPTPIPLEDHRFRLLIIPTTITKLEGQIFQAKTIIVT